jgi:hypothetical protein
MQLSFEQLLARLPEATARRLMTTWKWALSSESKEIVCHLIDFAYALGKEDAAKELQALAQEKIQEVLGK